MSLPVAPLQVIAGTEGKPPPDGAAGFDAARAYALLLEQCALGPRVPGTPGHDACRALLLRELGAYADVVAVQPWAQRIHRGPGAGRTLPMTNVFGLVRGTADAHLPPDRVRPELMLCAHWDTRPVADQDPDPARRGDPVPGANDGASGVAVVLEAARALRAARPRASVLLALWDGEDLGEYYYGSRLYARNRRRPELAPWVPRRAVLLDMVGKCGLRFTTELNSIRYAPELWAKVNATLDRLGLQAHTGGPAGAITDDHVFLNRAGIPSVLLIDYAYPQWHTTADTPDRCCPRSLQVAGDVALALARDGAA